MGKIKKDWFRNGFTVYNDDGSREHFRSQIFKNGFTGDKGTKIKENLFGGYRTNDGTIIKRNLLNNGFHASDGTKIKSNVFRGGYTIFGGKKRGK
jgi:hypothetical protein